MSLRSINNRGEMVTNIVAGIIVIMAILGAAAIFRNVETSKRQAAEMESAGDIAAKKLETLLNAPWSTLTVGEHTDANTTLSWIVTDVGPRLKKIDVVSKHQHKVTRDIASRGFLVSGYRYYDF